MKLALVFGLLDSEKVNLLKQGFETHPQITAEVLNPSQVRTLPGLSAFFLSITVAPSAGVLAQLFTKPKFFERGPRIVPLAGRLSSSPGVGFSRFEDPADPKYQLRVIVATAVEAVMSFNAREHEAIQTIGFESGWTGIEKIPPLEAAQIVCAAYDEATGFRKAPDEPADTGKRRDSPHDSRS